MEEKNISGIFDSYAKYEPRFQFNRAKWGDPSGNNELNDGSKDAAADSQQASATYLKNWLSTRFNAVDTVISGLTVK